MTLVPSFLDLLQPLHVVMTTPSFANFVTLLTGWVYARRRTVTGRDLRPGCITFYDPRGAVNMTAIKRDPYIEAEFTLAPRPGLILLWPAFLHHFVHPNLSEEPRVSISYNVVLKWSDDYLPTQG